MDVKATYAELDELGLHCCLSILMHLLAGYCVRMHLRSVLTSLLHACEYCNGEELI